jgi:hypothetical protein
VIAAWAVILSQLPNTEHRTLWAVLFGAQALFILVPLAILRGNRLELTHRGLHPETPANAARPWQFSILYLLVWMTALGMLLGALKSLDDPRDGTYWSWIQEYVLPVPGIVLVLFTYVAGRAAVALAALWAVLGTARPLWAVALVVAASAGSFGLLRSMEYHFAFYPAYSALLHLMEVALLLTTLLVVRLAGWRVGWRPAVESAEATERDPPAAPSEST